MQNHWSTTPKNCIRNVSREWPSSCLNSTGFKLVKLMVTIYLSCYNICWNEIISSNFLSILWWNLISVKYYYLYYKYEDYEIYFTDHFTFIGTTCTTWKYDWCYAYCDTDFRNLIFFLNLWEMIIEKKIMKREKNYTTQYLRSLKIYLHSWSYYIFTMSRRKYKGNHTIHFF